MLDAKITILYIKVDALKETKLNPTSLNNRSGLLALFVLIKAVPEDEGVVLTASHTVEPMQSI